MESPVRVVQYGLGPIGQATAGAVLDRAKTGQMELVGAVDVDPQMVGRDVATLLDDDRAETGVVVTDRPAAVLHEQRPDVVLHTTTSALPVVDEQLRTCVAAGAHVVSSTEELAYPYDRHPERAKALDRRARAAGVVVVGTGVNPGYAMDTLPLTATGVCTSIDAVRVARVVDAGERRGSLQTKIGVGCAPAEFEAKTKDDALGHVGLQESLRMVARGLGWTLADVRETIAPVRADRAVETPHCSVEEGGIAGLHQTAVGVVGGRERLSLDLQMYLGAEESYDAVQVEGTPPIDLRVDGGIFGDTATVGILVNTASLLDTVPSGLKTMLDLPVPRANL
ncbi:MAG: dihydrodipicolinate reductase [Bacteroidetes bacterium SW_9_63_38]|nr:MAG: dihydrodipicolinate reductase [Bacteroidetes bacterium SW_9_63_38]